MQVLEKIDDFFTVEGLKDNWAFLAVSAIFVLALGLRYMPEQGMKYLQALDPYMIYRLSQHLAMDGNLPAMDFFRYFPYQQPIYKTQFGDIFFPALFYWLGPFLFFGSYLEWAQFYPALMGAVGVVFAYFFGKEVWDKKAGVSAAFFLATISGVMHRTSAGFFEKEPIGTMFMMVSLYFFTRGWKRNKWLPGIFSGLALGFFTISWGGSKMLWLLYPLTVGIVMLLDEDIHNLVKTYAPTIIIGSGVAAALDPSEFWFTGELFLANIALVGFLWSRYLLEELELIEEKYLKFYVPTASITGLIFLGLSPLYSDFIASKVLQIYGKVTQSGGAVIAGTVAENTPASLGQIVSQLGAYPASQINPTLGMLSYLVGTWPLAFIGVALLGTNIVLMIGRKYSLRGEKIQVSDYVLVFLGVFLTWLIIFSLFFQTSIIIPVAPSVLLAVLGLVFFSAFYDEIETEMNWYYLLPFFWVITNVLGAVSKSRLVFLAAFPVAVVSGYTFSRFITRLYHADYDIFEGVSPEQLRAGIMILVLATVAIVNAASGFSTAQNIRGSPNQAWMNSLNYMENQTEPGSVILSWWDYGYWFESIGRRPAVADGGNAGYYTSQRYGKTNYPIADFFTSTSPENHTELFEKHSVDYLVLDNTMIGKYAAVSQISNRDNSQFNSMLSFSTRGGFRDSLARSGNKTMATFYGASAGIRRLRVYVPIEVSQTGGVKVNNPPLLESPRGRSQIDCVLTENGKKTFKNVSQPSQFCLAEDPYWDFNQGLKGNRKAKLVLVPKKISEVNLVRLYLMDGHGIDYVEKIPEASNGYVKMWKVDLK